MKSGKGEVGSIEETQGVREREGWKERERRAATRKRGRQAVGRAREGRCKKMFSGWQARGGGHVSLYEWRNNEVTYSCSSSCSLRR